MNYNTIIIVGPEGVGKTVICNHLAFQLDLPVLSMDEERKKRIKLPFFSKLKATYYKLRGGFWGIYNFIKPYEFQMVEDILSQEPKGVIDMGAGNIIYPSKQHHERIKELLSNYKFVFLLLPNKSKELSLKYLNHSNPILSRMKPNMNEYFLDFPYEEMVKYTIYTKNKHIHLIVKELMKIVKKDRKSF